MTSPAPGKPKYPVQTAEIKRRWLSFFDRRDHTVVPSASLVTDDPTLMFTVAGMVPFIPYFTGVVPSPFPRATSVQKCIRTLDIEEVGKTTRHGTFFQMNGNFSFGDYFKEQAIAYAWELLTTSEADGGLAFAEQDLWVTVYEDDEEAAELWKKIAGLPAERIQRLGRADNYWHTGQSGPGGPCSEIYVDRGPAYGIAGGPAANDSRYLEIWNLVFMQHLIGQVRSKVDFEIVGELPQKNIDTGMGMERVAFLKQGVDNLYEIDQVRPVLDTAAALVSRSYGKTAEDDVRLRIIADHVRSSLMLMTDGVSPSNEGRGYILRRLLRRVVRSMRLLGAYEPSFTELFASAKAAMQESYPEVEAEYQRVSRLAVAEEETFLATLSSGTSILDVAVTNTQKSGKTSLPGKTAFLLHDTFGFPIDLTLEIAQEAGLGVDRVAFEHLMSEQRKRAKADANAKKAGKAELQVYAAFRAHGESVFTGYHELNSESRVLGIIADGVSVNFAKAGEKVEIILAETSLYPESGGQVADKGRIVGTGFDLEILDVQRPIAGLISHSVRVSLGEVTLGEAATTLVDPAYRRAATAAHSATHLVHAALRQTLGKTAHQSGSYNRGGYLRLDFSWNQPLSQETRSEIEEITNTAVRENLEVITRILPLDEAKKAGAMALFGEKYGDLVRMVDIGGSWSRELCAGTHVRTSAEIGLVNLISESSVGSANRRVEALVGAEAFADFAAERALLGQISQNLKTPREKLPERISELVAQLKAAEKQLQAFTAAMISSRVPDLALKAHRLGTLNAVLEDVGEFANADELRKLAVSVREKLGGEASVVALAGQVGEKAVVMVATNQVAREAGHKAGALARAAATILGGGGGGKDDFAQGGGSDSSRIGDALSEIRRLLGER